MLPVGMAINWRQLIITKDECEGLSLRVFSGLGGEMCEINQRKPGLFMCSYDR